MILQDYNKKHPFGTISVYRTPRKEFIKPRPKRERYSGKVWLLTSHYTFSSAVELAWVFNYLNLGTLVGEETGGAVSFFRRLNRVEFTQDKAAVFSIIQEILQLWGDG